MNTKQYGKLLAEYRELCGLSQSEAGRRLGLARETFSLHERGIFTWAAKPEDMQRIEDVLGFPVQAQLEALGYALDWAPQSSLQLQLLKALDDMPEELQALAPELLRVLRRRE